MLFVEYVPAYEHTYIGQEVVSLRKRRRAHIHVFRLKNFSKRCLSLIAVGLTIRLLSGLGAGAALDSALKSLSQNSAFAQQMLSVSLPNVKGEYSVLTSLLTSSPLLSISERVAEEKESDLHTPEPTASPQTEKPEPTADISPSKAPETSALPETSEIETITPEEWDPSSIEFKNYTSFEPDVETLLYQELSFSLSSDLPQILIIHTHGSESYLPDEKDYYVPTDPYRTEDTNYNVVRVGDELAEAFENQGFSVLHDRSIYDYPSYNGAYANTEAAISEWLEEYPSIQIVIDVHRDAFDDVDGSPYQTDAEIDGVDSAQVMFVIGTGEAGLEHPNWQENLSFVLKRQASMNSKYPELARPVYLSQNRYNQQMTKGSFILEVGCNGNTLSQALTAVQLFAECSYDVISSLVE